LPSKARCPRRINAKGAVNAPRTGEQLQDVIMRAYASPTRVVERIRELNNPGK
jgi:hypothetical protein